MDRSRKLTIYAIAYLTGLKEAKVRRALTDADVASAGVNEEGVTCYDSRAALPVVLQESVVATLAESEAIDERAAVEKMSSRNRKIWYEAETKRLDLLERENQLISVQQLSEEVARVAQIVAVKMDTLPTLLELKVGLGADAVTAVEAQCDALRYEMAAAIEQQENGDS